MTAAYPRAVGMLWISSRSSVRCFVMVWTSTIGLSPETVIVSSSAPTFRSAFERGDEVGRQHEPLASDGGEPGQRERDGVGAGPQIEIRYCAGPVGDRRRGPFQSARGSPLPRSRRAARRRRSSLTIPVIDDPWAIRRRGNDREARRRRTRLSPISACPSLLVHSAAWPTNGFRSGIIEYGLIIAPAEVLSRTD